MRAYRLAFVAVAASLAACSNGNNQITSTCPSGETACNGECVNVQTDVQNCGACGTICPAGETCSNSTCAVTCPTGSALCASGELSSTGAQINICVDERADNLNCGACGQKCTNGTSCVDAGCVSPLTQPTLCSVGETTCVLPDSGFICTNVASDPFNCGGCGQPDGGHVCPGGELCQNFECTATCVDTIGVNGKPLQQICEGLCTNTQTDNGNCGGCFDGGLGAAAVCSPGDVCSNGQCTASCASPFLTCSGLRPFIPDSGYNPDAGNPDAGYCADEMNDPLNCGSCHNACPQGVACLNGECQLLCPSSGQSCATPQILIDAGVVTGNTCCGSALSVSGNGCISDQNTLMVAYQLPGTSLNNYLFNLTPGFVGSYTPAFCLSQAGLENATCTDTVNSSFPAIGGPPYFIAIGQLDGGCGEFTLTIQTGSGI